MTDKFIYFSNKYHISRNVNFNKLTTQRNNFTSFGRNAEFWNLVTWMNSTIDINTYPFPGNNFSLFIDKINNFIFFNPSYNLSRNVNYNKLTTQRNNFTSFGRNAEFWNLVTWMNSTIDINTYPFPGNLIPDNNFILFAKESRQLRITLPPTENIESIDSNLSYFTDTNGDVGISSFLTIYFDGPIVFKTGITMPSFEGNQLTYHIGSDYYSLELINNNNVILKNDTIYDIITSDLLDADLPDILRIDIGLGYISDNVKTEDTILYTSDSALDTNAGLYADGFNHLNGLFEIVVN